MDDTSIRRVMPNLVSLWSGMLGGAMGATAGRLSDTVEINALFGLLGGLIFSVLIYLPLMMVAQLVSLLVMRDEIDDQPIGCSSSDRLTAILGAAAGLVGAIIVTSTPERLTAPRGFLVCWTVAALVPTVITFALIWRARD
jgi:hypothetical protein